MAEYIGRAAAIESVKHAWAKGLEPSQYIEAMPAADVAPVVHGHWVEQEDGWGGTYYDCSICGESWTTIDGTPMQNNMNYCPVCGAKMDGGADHAAD